MKEQNLKKWAEQQYRLKVSKLINSVTIAQTVADQTLQFADKCMTAQEREDSDACRAMENLSCVCEETLRVLCEELNRGTGSMKCWSRATQIWQYWHNKTDKYKQC